MTDVTLDHQARIRAVVCDLDGVLRHFDPESLAHIECEHGLEPGAILRVAFAPDLLLPAVTGTVPDAQWRSNVADVLARSVGDDRARSAVGKWSASAGSIDAEALDLLCRARRTAAVVILTNATSRLPEDLRRLGVEENVFDDVVSSAVIGRCKPDPDAFQAARRAVEHSIGPAEPRDLLFIDDDPRHVAAAGELGWQTVLFRDPPTLARELRQLGLISTTVTCSGPDGAG